MSYTTIGIYPTDNKDFWKLIENLNKCLKIESIKAYLDELRGKYITVAFNFENEIHGLNVHFDLDNEHKMVFNGPKILFSLRSEEKGLKIMYKILHQFSFDRICYLIPYDTNPTIFEIIY